MVQTTEKTAITDESASCPSDAEAEPAVPTTVLPKEFCGRCCQGYYYRSARDAGWRRAHAHDTPETIAWTTPGSGGPKSEGVASGSSGAIYHAPRGEPPPVISELCNCVRRLPENDYPQRRWQHEEYAKFGRA